MNQLLKYLEYTFWANDLFIVRLKEQQDLPKNIADLMSHTLTAHRIWLERIGNSGTLPSAWDTIAVENWEGINIELYNESCDLVKSTSLEKYIEYKNSAGKLYKNSLQDILMHAVNHSTHHRAQIAMYMRQNHILPPQSDYIFYLRHL